jgi:hypothetical protein
MLSSLSEPDELLLLLLLELLVYPSDRLLALELSDS